MIIDNAYVLFERFYFIAALLLIGLGLWLALGAPHWRGRVLGVVLTQLGAVVLLLGAGASASLIGGLVLIAATTIGLASAFLMRLQRAEDERDPGEGA